MEGTQSGGAARFSCPPNFTAIRTASEPSRFSLERLTGPDTELWLIQAPADFAPDCLNGRLVTLSGSHIVKGKVGGKRHRYQVLCSSDSQAREATVLAPSAQAGGGLTCAPSLQGSIRIIEGPQESLSGISLQPIPTSPPPQIPPGLRPRFCAFGGSPPVRGPGSPLALKSPSSGKRKKRQMPEGSTPQEAVNGHGAPEVETEMDVGKKKKKKHRLEAGVTEPMVTEPKAEMSETLGVLFPLTSKKQKQPKGTETVEPTEKRGELQPVVKTESPEEMVLSPTKKRKRQEEVEGMELVEGVTVDSQPQVKEELQEEAIPLTPMKKKKKKKEKRPEVATEPGTEALETEVRALVPHGQVTEPELPEEVEPQAKAGLVSTKKRKKKEKWQNVMPVPGAGVVQSELSGDLEPQAALASTKEEEERGHKVAEPRTEMSDPVRETVEPELEGEGEPHARTALGSTKKKRKRGQEKWVAETVPPEMPEIAPQEEMPELPLNLESEEVAHIERKKKRKRKPQLDPV